jgi:hypothetical protein
LDLRIFGHSFEVVRPVLRSKLEGRQSVLDSVNPAGKDLSIFLPALFIRSNASLSENAWKRHQIGPLSIEV